MCALSPVAQVPGRLAAASHAPAAPSAAANGTVAVSGSRCRSTWPGRGRQRSPLRFKFHVHLNLYLYPSRDNLKSTYQPFVGPVILPLRLVCRASCDLSGLRQKWPVGHSATDHAPVGQAPAATVFRPSFLGASVCDFL